MPNTPTPTSRIWLQQSGKTFKTIQVTSGAGAAAATTLAAPAAGSGKCWCVRHIICSYSATPTNGKLTITDSSGTVEFDLPTAGPFELALDKPLKATKETNLVITVAGGGGGVVAKLNILDYWTEDDDSPSISL